VRPPTHSASRRVCRGGGLLLAAAVVVMGAALTAGPVEVGAQALSTPTPFPRPLVAFVPVPATGPADPALAIQTLAAGEGSGTGTGGARRVTVGFASSFPLPTQAYRVSVLWGSPGGAQTRASMISAEGTTSGVVETSTDGRTWNDAGATTASFGDDSVAIDATLGEASEGAAFWAQAQLGTAASTLVTTPVYSLDAIIGRAPDGGLPATSWGSSTEASGPGTATASPPVAFGTPAPTLTVDNKALIIHDPAPAPTKIDGQAVTRVIDEVTFLPGYTPSGTVSGVVQIDRTAGTIRALSGATPPEDRTGGGSWIVDGIAAPPASFNAPVTVTLDLEGVTTALGVPLDAAGTGLGLRRTVALADGSVVIGLPVIATVGWFQTAAVPTEAPLGTAAPEAASTHGAGAPSTSPAPLVAATVVAAALIGVALVFRRRHRHRMAMVAADLFATSEPDRSTAIDADGDVDAAVGPGVDAGAGVDEASSASGGRSPAEVLATLDAQVDVLSARVERLGRADDGQP